jgi:heterodisulfide reductase subunit B2
MKYGYYPGCCLNSTCRDFDISIRAVFRALDIDIEEIKRWVCCGSSAVHVASRYLSVVLSMDNLAKAQKQGLDDVLVPCAACYARFKFALHDIGADNGLRREVEQTLKHCFTEKLRVIHPLELMAQDDVMHQIETSRKRDLSSLKVVCYYGCYLSRPPDHFDDAEYPQAMDRIMKAAGTEVLDWGYRTDCCGGNFSVTRTDIALNLSRAILDGAKEAGADAIVVTCPFCHMNLDARQGEIEEKYGTSYNLPIYYYSQIIAAALGTPDKDLMLHMHFVHSQKLIQKAGANGK